MLYVTNQYLLVGQNGLLSTLLSAITAPADGREAGTAQGNRHSFRIGQRNPRYKTSTRMALFYNTILRYFFTRKACVTKWRQR